MRFKGLKMNIGLFGLYWLQRPNLNSLFCAPIHEGLALSIWFGYYEQFLRTLAYYGFTNKPKSTRNIYRIHCSNNIIFIFKGDLESIAEVDKENGIDMKQLKYESRRKDLLQSHSQITKELIQDHALGHVSILDKLQIEYISAKKK